VSVGALVRRMKLDRLDYVIFFRSVTAWLDHLRRQLDELECGIALGRNAVGAVNPRELSVGRLLHFIKLHRELSFHLVNGES
jgi:hypothetical protein